MLRGSGTLSTDAGGADDAKVWSTSMTSLSGNAFVGPKYVRSGSSAYFACGSVIPIVKLMPSVKSATSPSSPEASKITLPVAASSATIGATATTDGANV